MDGNGSVSSELVLGKRLQLARKHANLTQQQLCARANLSYSTLAKIERGAIKSPSIFTIQSIAGALNVTLDELVGSGSISTADQDKQVSRSGIRFVFFDLNGCLVRAAVTKAAAALSADSGVPLDVIESLFWQYNTTACRGDMSVDELNTILAKRLGIMVDWNKYYLAAVEPTPGIAELLAWVSERYHIGILTNTLPGLLPTMLENGILPQVEYDVIIDSSEVHAVKPEPEMFEAALARAGVGPSETLLIDDDRLNLAAAGQMGWHTLSFDAYQPEESIAAIRVALEPTS